MATGNQNESSPESQLQTNGDTAPVTNIADSSVEQPTLPRPEHASSNDEQTTEEHQKIPAGPMRTDTTTALAQAQSPPELPLNSPATSLARTTSSAIGPSSDHLAAAPSKEETESGPQLQLTLLLTNGARHPFKLDARYLAKRSIEVQDNDPFKLSVYKLKELILREWREEWEQKPTNPSYIRLISFGRLLDDKSALKDNRFNPEQSNVVHMTIKPQDFADEDEGKGAKSSFSHHPDGTEGRSPSCRCIVM